MKRKLLAFGFVAIGVAALCYAAQGQGARPIGIVAAVVAFVIAGSLISPAAAVAGRLRAFIGSTVTASAWGEPLPGGEAFEFVSVRAIGAGLHIYLRTQGSSPIHLKLAQPRQVQISASGFDVADAKYIQWAGRKLARHPSAAAFVVRTKN